MPPRRGARRRACCTATGSSPANGSSRTSSSGSCSSAAASCARCWLPCESSSTFASARSASPRRSSHVRRSRPARRPRSGRAGSRSTRAARRPASADRGRAPPACSRSAAAPRARSAGRPRAARRRRADEPEDGAHRRRLAGAVRPEEAEHPPARDRERAVGERLHGPEPLAHLREGEHRAITSSVAGTVSAQRSSATTAPLPVTLVVTRAGCRCRRSRRCPAPTRRGSSWP